MTYRKLYFQDNLLLVSTLRSDFWFLAIFSLYFLSLFDNIQINLNIPIVSIRMVYLRVHVFVRSTSPRLLHQFWMNVETRLSNVRIGFDHSNVMTTRHRPSHSDVRTSVALNPSNQNDTILSRGKYTQIAQTVFTLKSRQNTPKTNNNKNITHNTYI